MDRKEKLLIMLTGVSVVTLVVSNLLALKLINICGIPFDAGVILFPVAYVTGDLVMEFFGRKKADMVVVVSMVCNLVAVGCLALAVAVPAYPGWEGQESFAAVFTAAPRIVVASVTAYLVSGFLNNKVFEVIRKWSSKSLFLRAVGSSMVAKLADTVIFETVAFLGVLSFGEFVTQAVAAYVVAMVFETILFVVATKPAVALLRRYLKK